MHRRIRLATIVSVLVAVVLLGVPLVIFAIQVTQRATLSELQGRISTLARVVDSSSDIGFDVNKDMIDDYADGSVGRLSAHVTITLPDGATVQGGPTVGKPSITKFTHTTGGADIDYSYSWWRLQRLSAWGPGLVLVAAAVAIAAGVAMAQFQAKRLTQPLVYLAASAEQAGSGQVRPRLKASGIEEIDLVAEELSRSAERMARRLAAEREFAADASHQLRTPLTALSMRLEEIEGVTDQPEVAEEARVSLEQIERLTQTINELLGRSSRESRSDSIEVLRLADIMSQQAAEWSPVFRGEHRRLEIDVPGDIAVLATPGALSQVIATLIENSVKHGGGTTKVTASRGGKNVTIEVSDEGPGVDDDIAPHIFERHVTSGGGTGLGLALARDLTAADGGRLELAQRRPPIFRLFLKGAPAAINADAILPAGDQVDPMG